MVEFACDAPDCGYVVERRGMSWELPRGWVPYQGRFFHSLNHLAETLAQEVGQEIKGAHAVIVEIDIDYGEGHNNDREHPYDERKSNTRWQVIRR